MAVLDSPPVAAAPGEPGASADPATEPNSVDVLRENEFYRYYEPFRASLKHRRRLRAENIVRSSDDRALTAFAQLGALRLNARRCTISFFDRKTQYVLAEATRTLSLQSDVAEDPKDALLWGVLEFPLEDGLCQHTLRKPLEYIKLEDGRSLDVTVNCFPNMLADPRFSDLPFVCGDAHTRFYAAVPILSPNGLALGSYCVMDDEPRDGLTPSETAFMKDMATTVMVHLEMVRAREEIRRNALFIQGLGSFIEGNSSTEKSRSGDQGIPWKDTPPESWDEKQYSMQQLLVPAVVQSSTVAGSTASTECEDLDPGAAQRDSAETEDPLRQSSQPTPRVDPAARQPSVLDKRDPFRRAANIIRECLDVDGVVVYDAEVGSFGGLVNPDSDTDRGTSSEGSTARQGSPHKDSSSDGDGDIDKQSAQRMETSKPCTVLGFATANSSASQDTESSSNLKLMTESLLRRLMRKHPVGQAFSLGSSDTSPSRVIDEIEICHPSRRRRRGLRSPRPLRSRDVHLLRQVFPGIRSVMVVPFYDSVTGRSYAGGIVWSTDPKRVFSQESLAYLAAFADSVMAEVARIRAMLAERVKSDFISSISHELRSPMHGILGGIECLADEAFQDVRADILHSIEICGMTLLDTIDHLLDYAKINHFSDSETRGDRGGPRGRTIGGERQKSEKSPLETKMSHGRETYCDIALVTEEVVRTVQAGHFYGNGRGLSQRRRSVVTLDHEGPLSSDSQDDVKLILDLGQATGLRHRHRTQVGAWRRIVMNLVGNSRKYTAEGHIKISLRVLPCSQSDSDEIVLVVSDTGCGISKEFLQKDLFTPFVQENALAPGTGLGLSIIQRIIKDIGGTIVIKSEKGKGTVAEVRLLLPRAPGEPLPNGAAETLPQCAIPIARSTTTVMSSDPVSCGSLVLEQELKIIPPKSFTESEELKLAQPLSALTILDEHGRESVSSPPKPEATPAAALDSSFAMLDRPPRRVLLVDDNEINLRLLTMFMKKHGHPYAVARNGLEALEAFKAASDASRDGSQAEDDGIVPPVAFDLVLMDISMPVMDGLESARLMRAHERQLLSTWRDPSLSAQPSAKADAAALSPASEDYVPATIIAVTGLTSAQTRQEAHSSGVNSFMSKPVRLANLARLFPKKNVTPAGDIMTA